MYVFGDGLRAMEDLGRRRQKIFDALPPSRQKEVALMMWAGEANFFIAPLIALCALAVVIVKSIPDHRQQALIWSGVVLGALGILKMFLGTEGARWTYRVGIPPSEWPKALLLYIIVPVVEIGGAWFGVWTSPYYKWGIGVLGVALIIWGFLVNPPIPTEMDLWGKKKETKA